MLFKNTGGRGGRKVTKSKQWRQLQWRAGYDAHEAGADGCKGQLWRGGNRPEVEEWGGHPVWQEYFRWPGQVGGRSCALPPPPPALGSAPPSCTPSAAWTSRPPAQLRGPCVGSPNYLAAFSRALTSHKGLVFQTK